MQTKILGKLFEHNNWANIKIILACSDLSDEQLDADPGSATKGSIRLTLWHLVAAQQYYLSLLNSIEPPFHWQAPPAFDELREATTACGEGLLALAKEDLNEPLKNQIKTENGYSMEPWVVMVQAINHATEHREQIKSMLSSQGVTAPELDGWSYGEATNAFTQA